MPWILNRTGQPEGPFEDAQIIQMIQSGQLTNGHISQPGTNQWLHLQQHPPFAQALQALQQGQAQPGQPQQPGQQAWGQQQGQPQQGQPPQQGQQQQWGQQQGQQQWGQPGQAPGQPGGYPGAPAQPGYGGQVMPPGGQPKKGGAAGIAIGVVGLLAVVGVVLAVFVFGGGGSKLSASVPKDIEFFAEVPSMSGAFGKLADMGFVNDEKLDGEKYAKQIIADVSQAFELKKDDAESLVGGVESIAIAARNLNKGEQGAILVKFSDGDGVEKLLKGARFTKEDEVGGGTRYTLKREEVKDAAATKTWTGMRKSLAYSSYSKESSKVFVWFEDENLLVMGKKELVEDIGGVVLKGKDSLSDSDKWGEAELDSGAAAIVFVDSAVLKEADGEDEKKLVKGFFEDVKPFTGAIKVTDAGIVASTSGVLKGNQITEDDELPSSASLDLYEKLPAETFAYLAVSTKKGGDGKDLRKQIITKAKKAEEKAGEQLEKMLDEMEKQFGVGLADVVDALGDQMVIAGVADKALAIDPEKGPSEAIDKVAGVMLFAIGEKDDAKKVIKALREKLFVEGPMKDAYTVSDKGGGFDAEPKEKGAPAIKVRLDDDHLLITGGGLAARVVEAFEKEKNTLSDDAAHKKALGSLDGSPRMLVWVDVGRIGKLAIDMMEKKPETLEMLGEVQMALGVSHDMIKWTGEDRITAAAALSLDSSGETWKYRLDTLNAPAFGVLAGVAVFGRMGGGARPSIPDAPSGKSLELPGHYDFQLPAGGKYSLTELGNKKLHEYEYDVGSDDVFKGILAKFESGLEGNGWKLEKASSDNGWPKYEASKGSTQVGVLVGKGTDGVYRLMCIVR